MPPLIRVAFVFAILHAMPVWAQTAATITFDSCRDAKGHSVAVQADSGIKDLVSSGLDAANQPVIRYNPQVLPQLLPESRYFLFAHECARHYLGMALGSERTLAQARRADCEALAALRRSGLVEGAGAVDAIEEDLAAVSDWSVLPAPQRKLALGECKAASETRGATALPRAPARSEAWSKCVQSCGAKLYSCGRAASCQSAYDACSKTCGD